MTPADVVRDVSGTVDVAAVRAELRAQLASELPDNDDHDAPPGGWLPGERESLGRLAALVGEGEDCDG